MILGIQGGLVRNVTAGRRIMQLRTDRSYTREQLAYLANISENFYMRLKWIRKDFRQLR